MFVSKTIIHKKGALMYHFVYEELLEWKNSKYRKPLILNGERQVGKTNQITDVPLYLTKLGKKSPTSKERKWGNELLFRFSVYCTYDKQKG